MHPHTFCLVDAVRDVDETETVELTIVVAVTLQSVDFEGQPSGPGSLQNNKGVAMVCHSAISRQEPIIDESSRTRMQTESGKEQIWAVVGVVEGVVDGDVEEHNFIPAGHLRSETSPVTSTQTVAPESSKP